MRVIGWRKCATIRTNIRVFTTTIPVTRDIDILWFWDTSYKLCVFRNIAVCFQRMVYNTFNSERRTTTAVSINSIVKGTPITPANCVNGVPKTFEMLLHVIFKEYHK